MAKNKSIPSKSHYSSKPRINVKASIRKLKDLVEKTNHACEVVNAQYKLEQGKLTGVKTRKKIKQKVGTAHLYTGISMLLYFVKCFEKGKTVNGRFNFTHSYFTLIDNETCTNRTVFNRINRLIDIGIISGKKKSVADFENGKGATNCVEAELNKELLLFWDQNINKNIDEALDKREESNLSDYLDESLKKGLEATVANLSNKFKYR